VRNGNADVTLQCLQDAACAGRLLLQSLRAPGATIASAGQKPTTYGSQRFRIAAHGRKAVPVKLSQAARRLLNRRHALAAWANVTFGGVKYAWKLKLKT
jgi:hypothetical protein